MTDGETAKWIEKQQQVHNEQHLGKIEECSNRDCQRAVGLYHLLLIFYPQKGSR